MLEILLVDDDELVRQSLSMLLTHEGFRVCAVKGGSEALEVAKQQGFDLVISDIRMPDMDGFEVVRQLRDLQSDAHFVLITGYASEDAPVQALRLKLDDYFRKPFDLNFFLERIRQFRRSRKQRRGLSAEQALESFTAWLRRRPGFSDKTDPLEERVIRAAQRLGLDSPSQQALRLAVRFQDLVADLPQFADEPLEAGDSVAEQAARLLILCGARPYSQELAVQLLLAAMHQRRPQDPPPPVDGRIWQELGAPQTPTASHPGQLLRVHTLGQTRVAWGEQEISPSQWESHRARWLFVYLVSRRGQWVAAERLRDMFWPESEADKAQRSLVSTIHRCRKALGESSLLQRSERGYAVEQSAALWWDLDQLERCYRQAQSSDPEPALRQLEALYQGEFCPDCPYEWAEPVRHQSQRMALEGLEQLARLLLEEDAAAAESRARKALRLEPTSEGAAEILLRALWAQGRRDEAVRTYRDFGQRLERELNLPPGPELVRAYLELSGS
jgi:two-component SAPR family response regulator